MSCALTVCWPWNIKGRLELVRDSSLLRLGHCDSRPPSYLFPPLPSPLDCMCGSSKRTRSSSSNERHPGRSRSASERSSLSSAGSYGNPQEGRSKVLPAARRQLRPKDSSYSVRPFRGSITDEKTSSKASSILVQQPHCSIEFERASRFNLRSQYSPFS